MNNKIDFHISESQDFFDLSVQYFGGIEYLFDAVRKVNDSVGLNTIQKLANEIANFYPPMDDIVGSSFKLVNTENIGDPKVVDKLKLTNFVVNNSGSPNSILLFGIGVWIIGSDFTIT